MNTREIETTNTDLLPGGGEHARDFLETIMNNDLDGIIYLQAIRDNKNNPFDYIIRYYNPVFFKTYKQLKKDPLQPGLLLFEIFPGLKKNLTFFRAERMLGKENTAEFTKYFNNDGMDHWLNVRITRYMKDGFIVHINDKTNEIKERIWSEVNLKSSEMLLKNHYWRLAIPPILQQIHKASLATRVNFYLLEDLENTKTYTYHIIDSWMEEFIDPEQEKLRELEVFHLDDPNYRSLMDNLLNKRIIDFTSERIKKYPKNIQDFFKRKNMHRVVLVPIIYNDGLVGFIQIENPKGRLLYARERRTLRNIAENFSAAILRRITRKRIEESQIHYRTLVEKLNAVVYKTPINSPLYFTYINPNISEFIGIEQNEILSKSESLLNKIHPNDLPELQEKLNQASMVPQAYDVEFRVEEYDGKIRWINASAIVINDELGDPVEYLGYFNDITAQKDRLREMVESRKLESIGRFTGGIAHDLNNMIQPGMIYMSIIREAITEKEEFQKLVPKLDKAYTSLVRSRDLIRKILDFSRSKSNNHATAKLKPTLMSVVEDVEKSFHTKIEVLGLDLLSHDIEIATDSDSLVQVFYNILKNSHDATKDQENPEISLEILPETDKDTVFVKILDNGTGISEKDLEQVFDPFFTTKPMGEGTGLGLSIVYGIMKNIYGSVKVENRKNRGTRVLLSFPVIQNQKEPAQ